MQTPNPDIVREAIKSGITKAELTRRAGIGEHSLRQAESPEWNPTWKILTAVCRVITEITREREESAAQ